MNYQCNFDQIEISDDTLRFIKSLDEGARPTTPRSDIVLAATLFQIGQDLNGTGFTDAALEAYSRSLSLTTTALGTILHENVAKILYQIGGTYHARGDLQKAYKSFLDVWRVSKEVLGPDEVAESLFQMGRINRDLGRYDEATDIFREALRIRVLLHGEFHKDVAVIVCNIAMVHQEKKELDIALLLFQKVLQIGLSLWGPACNLIAEVLDMIGEIYAAMGEHDYALTIFDDALRIAAHVHRFERKLDSEGSSDDEREDEDESEAQSSLSDQVLMSSVLGALVCIPWFCAAAA